MLDIRYVRKNQDLVRQALVDRQMNLDMDQFVKVDELWRATIHGIDLLKNERSTMSADIPRLKKQGVDVSDLLAQLSAISDSIKMEEPEATRLENELYNLLYSIPNIPHETTPVGADERDNPVIRTVGGIPSFDFTPKEHWEIGAGLGMLDFERAAKITGSRFAVLRGGLARLERALVSFMLDMHIGEHGYTEVATPYIVNAESLRGTGQLPKFEEDLFKLDLKDRQYYLIPTAEVPVTNLHRDETLDEESLPMGYCAYTPCFRSEAGSYGKDTKGLIRQHQFDKVELVWFVRPEESYEQLERLTAHAEEVLKRLKLPYRVIALCTGDLGFSSAKTYDIEVWLPGQQAYREISSCSCFEDFQARRAGIRCKLKGGKARLAHTLNGSGLAVGRTMVAILENCQRADGSVVLPEALVPYMNGVEVLRP